ncbi:MAG: folate-binding protein [Burkholderiaceae bacterium]|jgi:tRNA-modifying protein YgfZ|nr:folate-binding protein [Burkholderiaceae bacterium]MDP4862666.1 folate-binding protein [Burkholderiaceae bacterium]
MTSLLEPTTQRILLTDWGVLEVRGDDATTFLQGQLTNDVALMPVGQARLSGYCSAKGRLLASFVVLKREANAYHLLMARDLLAATQKRLQMFVMRAKCQLQDVSDQWRLTGITGAETLADMPDWACQAADDGWILRLPSAEVKQAIWIQPVAAASPAQPSEAADGWAFHRALSGVAMVTQATTEHFVPQMVNYESVDGVSFKKGCYPGQEIVARSQFRGAIKRRAAVYTFSDPSQQQVVEPGMPVFTAGPDGEECGVVAAAGFLAGQWALTVSLQTAVADHAVALGAADGPVMTVQPLPYRIRDDI